MKPTFHRQRGKGQSAGPGTLAEFMDWASEIVFKAKPKAVRVQTADFTCSWTAPTKKPKRARKAVAK